MKQLVIFDIDGTLADNDHRVHHLYPDGGDFPRKTNPGEKPNWAAFFADQHLDTPREHVVNVLRMYQCCTKRPKIALLTGRGAEWREVTEQWLAEHHIHYDTLVMRPEGDRTDDNILKMNSIKHWQAEGYEIIGLYDDRKRICDAARAHGITVFQMAEGDF